MGLEIFQIGNEGKKAAQLLIESDDNWTSTITVQGHQCLNVGIRVGVDISDILSAASFSATISQVNSIFSGTITLQRRMPEEDQDYHWRDVSDWTISSTGAAQGGSENITAYPDPETAQYRAGIKNGDYTAGLAHIRIGTS